MAKHGRKRYHKVEMIDLSERRYMEIIEITDEDRESVDAEYEQMFKEVNNNIDKKVENYMHNLDDFLRLKLLTESTKNIDSSTLIREYNYLVNDEKKYDVMMNKFDKYYRGLINVEEQEN